MIIHRLPLKTPEDYRPDPARRSASIRLPLRRCQVTEVQECLPIRFKMSLYLSLWQRLSSRIECPPQKRWDARLGSAASVSRQCASL